MATPFDMDMSADPLEFDEAVAEFSGRRVVSRDEADGIADYARRRAWWITGVAQMDVVNDAHEALLDGLRNSKAFEDWQKEIGPKLEKAWGRKDSARILLIYRNATSSAYNAGRHAQMDEPEIRDIRPYRKLSPVADLRTSEICEKFISPPVILPIDDPRWLRLHPPFHHGCRTGIVTLRVSVAEKLGVTVDLPEFELDDGWGYPPNLTEPPKPDERAVQPPPEIQQEFAKKTVADLVKRKPVKIPVKPEHTVTHWVQHYEAKYGEAAPTVAYGRMVRERAKDLDPKEALSILRDAIKAKVPGVDPVFAKYVERSISGSGVANPLFAETGKILAQHLKLVRGRKAPEVDLVAVQALESKVAQAQLFFSRFASERVPIPGVIFTRADGRANYVPDARVVKIRSSDSAGTFVHEWTHGIEHEGRYSAGYKARVDAFREGREAGEELRKLRDIYPAHGYRDDEYTRKDKYYNAYLGKVYDYDGVSEVMSMILGDIADCKTATLLDNDPESLFFGLGLLAGH